MGTSAQKRALQNYRMNLAKRGMARFEVLGLDTDRELIRSLAKHLAEEGVDAARIRRTIGQSIEPELSRRRDIRSLAPVAACRR